MSDCDVCGRPLPVQTGRGGRRKRHEACKKPKNRPAARSSMPLGPASTVVESTRRALAALGASDSPRGLSALNLAARIDADAEPGAAHAALLREFRVIMAEIEATAVPAEDDPVEAAKADLRVVS